MILVMLLFAAFLAAYLGWCRAIYWQMRMDMVAEAVALSAARAQAGMLNNLATLQTAENVFFQKATVFGVDVAHMQVEMKEDFDLANGAVAAYITGFNGQTMSLAQAVARANGVSRAVPYPKPDHHLQPETVYVGYFAHLLPMGEKTYEKAYFTRKWGQGKMTPQPDHEVTWGVSKFGIVGTATARVWLDADKESFMNDGGFPSEDIPWWHQIGVQCLYPQFNARLVRTNLVSDQIIRTALKVAS
jgi:hypothetical protein